MGIIKWISRPLVILTLATIIILSILNIKASFEPPFLLPILNTLFLGFLLFVVAYFSAKIYIETNLKSALYMCCGMLVFGLGSTIAGWLRYMPNGVNYAVTIHNLCALAGSIFHLNAAYIDESFQKKQISIKRKKTILTLATVSVFSFLGLLTILVFNNLLPQFADKNGFTLIRQIVLWSSTAFYFCASMLFSKMYQKKESEYLFRYSMALALFSIGLFAVCLEPSVGSPEDWIGRVSQYIGGIYALLSIRAALKSAKASGNTFSSVISQYFDDANSIYKRVAETSNIAIVSVDKDFRILYVNPAAEALFRIKYQKAVGTSFLDKCISESGRAALRDRFTTFFSTGTNKPQGKPFEIEAKDNKGRLFPAEISEAMSALPSGYAITYVIHDISERKQAEDALRVSEKKYRLIIETAGEGIAIFRPEGNYTYVNQRMADMLGYPAEEILGKSTTDFSGEEWHPYVFQKRKALREGDFVHGEFKFRRRDGSDLWTLYNITPMFDDNGEHTANFAMYTDMTELHKAKEELETAKQRLETHIHNSPLAVVEFDSAFHIIRWSEEAERMFGWKAEEILGKSMFEVKWIYEDDIKLVDKESEALFNGKASRNLNINRNYTKDGSVIWCEWYDSAIYDDKGKMISVFSQVLNITGRRKAEEELRESENRARKLVQELEEMDKNKNEFLNALSHELRNPLAAISAGLKILDVAQESHQIIKTKEIMNRQMNQLCQLVDDLLDHTRVSNNKIDLKKETIELNKFVQLMAEDNRPLFNEKGIKLLTRTSPDFIYIDADPVRLKQIIGNLLHNAQKYTNADGEVILSVYEENREAVISVIDNGIGLSSEIIPRLFQPFVQADVSLDRGKGGLGLGLSITKGITELHGGTVRANSEGLGKGSEFIIRIPLSVMINDDKMDDTKKLEATKSPLKVLIIEDNKDLAELMCSLLKMLGHEAFVVYDGNEGIAKAREIQPHIVFCDIGLPGINGYDVAEILRENDNLKNVCLVAMTGYAGEADIQRAKESGFDKHMAKPVSLAALQQVLNEY